MNDVRFRRNRNLESIAVLYGATTFGLSQIIFNLVSVKPAAFSAGFPFIGWTFFWIQLLPFLILLALDLFFGSRGIEAKRFHYWRTVLYSALALSMLRQFQVFHAEISNHFFGSIPRWVISVGFLALIVPLIWRFRRAIDRYMVFLGALAFTLPLIFIVQLRSVVKASAAPLKAPDISCARNSPPVVLVVFDELSGAILMDGDKINETLYPHFATLAKDGIWCKNATTNHWATVDSLPTILTGKVHPSNTARTLLDYLPRSYHTTILLSEIEVENWFRYQLHNRQADRYLGKDHFVNVDPFSAAQFLGYRLWGFFTFSLPANILFDDPEYHSTLFQEIKYIQSLRIAGNELLLWHVSVPHSPFLFSRLGKRHHGKESFFPFTEEYRPEQFRAIMDNYVEQVRYADFILGDLVSRLKETGVYDKTIFIVASDHGLRVWGNLFRHVDLIANVPLIIRAPGMKPEVNISDIQLTDITPTILDLLGCKYPASEFDGVSILQAARPIRKKTVHFQPSGLQYVFNEFSHEWKIASKDGAEDRGADLMRKFSAVQVLDDVLLARETQQDFLTLYLTRHFPKSCSVDDLAGLTAMIASVKSLPENPQNNLKRGLYCFFLALAGSQSISQGSEIDATEVSRYWQQSVVYLGRTGSLQPWTTEEISALIRNSDTDRNGTLSRQELSNMIQSRPTEEMEKQVR